MPTLLGLMNIEVPESCQGQDLREAIFNKNDDAVQSTPLYQFDHNWRGIYTHHHTYAFSVLPNNKADTVSNCLYDKTTDPYEQHNLFHSAAHQDLKAELHEQTLNWMEKFGDDGLEWLTVLKQIVSQEDYDMLSIDKGWFEGSGATGVLKGKPIDIIKTK